MSEIQVCEGIWRNRVRQFVLVRRCEPVGGQQWTDGMYHVHDDGKFIAGRESNPDLLEYIGPLPDQSQRAPVSRPAETESTTAEIERLRIELQETYAGWSDSNSALAEQTVEINKLKAEWQTEFTAAQQLRSEVAQLERLLDDAREELRELREDREATGHHCEGMKAAFLAVIKTFVEMRS